MAEMEKFEIGSDVLTANVLAMGAELCSLRDATGREFLWQAGPPWQRHAPNLFPIVGRLKDDRLRHDGKAYHLTQHGFARDRRLTWLAREKALCRLALTDDAESRAIYPFAFRLILEYEVAGAALHIRFTLENPGTETLPASMGAHPAFNWPLAPGIAKTAHRLVFAEPESGPIFQVKGGLLQAATIPSPVAGRTLALDEALFDADALIFKPVNSRALRYEAAGGPALDISWDGFSDLGIWSLRGGDFVCIEPWLGYASPASFDGDFTEKPGLMHLAPGSSRTAGLTVQIGRATE
jgi:galactose mutarotase-like enzyme